MRYQDFVRVAAGVLATALVGVSAYAQEEKQPEPLTMTDTAPSPAMDRSSSGAVIMMDQPVLAQRAAMQAVAERTAVDTTAMGAGPARILRDVMTQEQQKRQRALDGGGRQRAPY